MNSVFVSSIESLFTKNFLALKFLKIIQKQHKISDTVRWPYFYLHYFFHKIVYGDENLEIKGWRLEALHNE